MTYFLKGGCSDLTVHIALNRYRYTNFTKFLPTQRDLKGLEARH